MVSGNRTKVATTTDKTNEVSLEKWTMVRGNKGVRDEVRRGGCGKHVNSGEKDGQYKEGNNLDKGKKVYVRSPKRRPSHQASLKGKLELEKKSAFRYSRHQEACRSTSSSESDWDHLWKSGMMRGENSKLKNRGKETESHMGNGLQKVSQAYSSPSNSQCSPTRKDIDEMGVNGPAQICVRHGNNNMRAILDQEGGVICLPLRSPIQLPLSDSEGRFIYGTYLVEIPLTAELEGLGNMVIPTPVVTVKKGMKRKNKKQVKSYWNLEEEISKVIEEGVARGIVFNTKGKETENGEEVTKNRVQEEAGRVETVDTSCNLGSMRSFNSFMLQGNVVDIPLQGIKYTWSNNRDREAWARLDRFLLSPIILLRFPNLVQKGLPQCLSDHNPILIGDLVWGSKGFVLYSKAKAAKANLKRWIKARKLTITMALEIEMKLEEIVSKAVIDGWTDSFKTKYARSCGQVMEKLS
ncbi:hypothetical protein Dsin_020473 [Dipteronia sinensis]|uniref:Uncharacterized protein n=1 Tax=Dipteronia sinensis TaxID=43782 RepID=A0AAE0E3I9_9ROSI|nr:hypothetical protein Dsin_020473 [Dipteronia sinensis]